MRQSVIQEQKTVREEDGLVTSIWNLIDTYNPDVVMHTESWLSEEINNAEVFRDNYIAFRRYRCSWGGGVFICVTMIAGSYGLMRILRW